jgi:serine/threonine protein kinase
MGVVYEAVQLSLSRRVALKVLPFAATFDARQLQRFKNEAQAAALLHHTNIVPIYAVGCERGVHFYAMQLIEGHSLSLLIRQLREQAGLAPSELTAKSVDGGVESAATDPYLGGVVPIGPATHENLRSTAGASLTITARAARGGDNFFQKVARLMLQAAEALEHAHQVGIVHRDIKPANLLVNTFGTLWVADFGLAQFQADASLTRTGDLVGTFRYMSPEQASGQRAAVDHRTDIYSLGATFYELLTLEPVFAGESRHELLYQILHGEPKAPRLINRSIPFELETIVLKALRKAPAERYASAAEFAEDLRRFLDHRPILARRPTIIDRLRKWSRRHPSVVVAGVLLLAVSLIAVSVSNRMIAREQEKTSDALGREKLSNRQLALEQEKTAEALGREQQRANEAEEMFHQARQAVDVLVEVSEEELADNFFVQHARKRLLQTALLFYQDFIDQRRGDAASQADLAAVEQRVKGILHELEILRRDMQTGLLGNPVVIRELRLDERQDEQVKELLAAWEQQKQQLRPVLESLHDDDERRRRFVELAEQRESDLEMVLMDLQLKRLGQLALQAQGVWAFKEPDVVAALELTSEQRAAIRKIEREQFGHGAGRGREPPDGPGPRPDRRPPRDHGPHEDGPPDEGPRGGPRRDRGPREGGAHDHRPPPRENEHDDKHAVAGVLALLTSTQLTRWQELTGRPVDGLHDGRRGRPSKLRPPMPPPPPEESGS